MLKKFAPFRVPASWYFINPENRWKIEGKSLQDLTAKVRLYRAQNEFPELDYLEAVIEHYLCTRRENIGGCEDRGQLKRGLIPMIKGGIVVLRNLMYNSFADQTEADRRSEICKDCPLNIAADMGPFVEWCNRVAENSVGDRKSKHHDSLYVCEGCGCPLRAKVFAVKDFGLTKDHEVKMRTANPKCWQLEGKI